MIKLDQAGIDAMKAGITDEEVLTYISILEGQNDRLHSHHSSDKEEMARLTEIAQRWRIQAFVVENLARWLNSKNPFWYPDDLRKEIKIHTDRLLAKWRRRENWEADDADIWAPAGALTSST